MHKSKSLGTQTQSPAASLRVCPLQNSSPLKVLPKIVICIFAGFGNGVSKVYKESSCRILSEDVCFAFMFFVAQLKFQMNFTFPLCVAKVLYKTTSPAEARLGFGYREFITMHKGLTRSHTALGWKQLFELVVKCDQEGHVLQWRCN